MFTVADAHRLAQEAHAGQPYGDDGDYYRDHLLPIAEDARPYGPDAEIVAVLHDAVEDTWVTLDYLRSVGMDEELVLDLDAVSRRPGEHYLRAFIPRLLPRPRARLIKLLDNRRNLRANKTLAETDPKKAKSLSEKRYKPARRMMLAAEAADDNLDRPRILT